MKRLLLALGSAALVATAPAHAQTAAAHPVVQFKTTQGDIRVELYPEKAPKTVANFLDYVKAGQYNGTIFHRVIPGFMIQGGGYKANFDEKPTRAPIPLESRNGLKNLTGTIAMARTSDPNSATAQFFINTVDNSNLDYPNPDGNGYAVFGKVVGPGCREEDRGDPDHLARLDARRARKDDHDRIGERRRQIIRRATSAPHAAASSRPAACHFTHLNEGTIMVELHTNHGVIKLELDAAKAPKSVENFLNYVKAGHYDNTVFHRVINGFMIQGGGFEPGMKQKPTEAPIDNEANNGLKNDTYTVAMARTNDPHSATAQFFINVNDNDFLNHSSPTPQGWGYAVFGKVVEGQDVVDAIKKVKTGSKGFHQDVPADDVIIEKAVVV